MHKMRKILFYLSLILIFFLQSFCDEKTVDLLWEERGLFVFSYPAVLDDESDVNLPFMIYSFSDEFSSVKIDSFMFLESAVKKDYSLISFYGNIPLSMEPSVQEKSFNGEFSERIILNSDSKTVKIFPFRYNESQLTYFKKVKIFFTPSFKSGRKEEPVYDYLIICPSAYDTVFERLKKWKTRRGFKTRLITTDSVFFVSSGIDSAERLRNFIVGEYNTYHFKYLLLGGDRASIPVRRMYAMDCNAEYYTDEDSIPADIYYSNLEGDFNFDNDGIYGEIEDSCDLTQEIFIGRILFDTVTYKPGPIITRIIDYEQTKDTEHLNRGMFLGMILWNPPFTPGGEAKEIIFNDIIPSDYHIKKFYEHWGHSGKIDILDSMDMGYGIVNHNGHGSFKGIWVDTLTSLSRGDMTGLTNGSKTGLFYSIGCWIGAFDRDNTTYSLHSITQNMQNSPTGGFVSIITNSRYGWGAPGYPGYGVSDMLDYRFFTLLFNESCKEGGYLLCKLKSEISSLSEDENLYRWHIYQLNYFGDPSTSIYTGYPDSVNMSLKRNEDILSAVFRKSDGSPAENIFVCISKDTIFRRGLTDANGLFEADLSGIGDSLLYITATGTMAATIIDSFNMLEADSVYVSLKFDTLFAGAVNAITLFNSSILPLTATIKSAFIDSTFSVGAEETLQIGYTPVASIDRADTLTLSVFETGQKDTFISMIKQTIISFDTIRFDNTVFKTTVSKNHEKTLKDMTLRIMLNGTAEILDTLVCGDFSGSISLSEPTGIPHGLEYMTVDAYLYKDDTLLSHKKEYINNGEFSYFDDFSSDLSNWKYHTSNWVINGDNQLYAGYENHYLNNMNDTIISNQFLIYPGSLCSIYIDAYLPSLEFIGGEPIFDLDGMFVKLIKEETDTFILDFISSGGALKDEQSMRIKGWRVYATENQTPAHANLLFQFISDSVIVDSGVYINSIKMIPPYHYEETTSITRDDKNIINNDKVKYSINGFSGDMEITIVAIDGRVIKRYNLHDAWSATLSFDQVPSGVYFVIFQSGKAFFKDKLIILK